MAQRKHKYTKKDIVIRSLLNKCKLEEPDVEEEYNDHQMVGYYATGVSEESRLVVCSPDLPLSVTHKPHITATGAPTISTTASNTHVPQVDSTTGAGMLANAVKRKEPPVASTPGAPATDDPYQCNICSKTFAVPARLTRHYRTHTGEKPFQCEYCAKSFSVKENLSVHRRIHTKERPYKCEVCARAFEHSGKLHRHMRIHTGERPHKCTVCSKTFIQSGQLVIHMRTHTGEKPYVCTVCNKGFTCSKQLKVHSRTHTGEKPYACDICGKSFGYNHVLKLHQVAHFGEKVYKCTICSDTFSSKKCMELHIKSHSDGASPANSLSPSDKENSENSNPPVQYEDTTAIQSFYINTISSERTDLIQPAAFNTSGVDILAQTALSVATDEARYNKKIYNSTTLLLPPYTAPSVCEGNLDQGDIFRRQIEAAIISATNGEPLTPQSTSPALPAPSSSPDSVEMVKISLPPRKRSKMILKSMQSEHDAMVGASVRYRSVIQYAKAS